MFNGQSPTWKRIWVFPLHLVLMLCHIVHPESFPIKHCTLRHQLGATGNCGDIWRELPLVLFSERTLLGWHLVAVPFSTLRQTVSVFKLQDSCNQRWCIVLVLSWPIILLSSRTPQDDAVLVSTFVIYYCTNFVN